MNFIINCLDKNNRMDSSIIGDSSRESMQTAVYLNCVSENN